MKTKILYKVSDQYCVDEEGFKHYDNDEIEELREEYKIKIIGMKNEVDESMRSGDILIASLSTITMKDGAVFKYNEGVYTRIPDVKYAAAVLGRKGGSSTSEKKRKASADNLAAARAEGKKGGRPRSDNPVRKRPYHSEKNTDNSDKK